MQKQGVVIKSTGSWFIVETEDGNLYNCKIKGSFRIKGIRSTNPLAVGDVVTFSVESSDVGLISAIAPRKNYIIRKATRLSKASHIIATNLDLACLIVTLVSPRTSRGFIDRFLVTSEAYHIPTAIVFNKIDLYDDQLREQQQLLGDLYTHLGYPCFAVSATRGDNLAHLCSELSNKIVLFSGHSGVGKSALINSLSPELTLRTGDLSHSYDKGKHTTTYAEMIRMPYGGKIIDTPGIKEFGLYDFEKGEISQRFPEMRQIMSDCKFHNCTHIHEPQCAVIEAVNGGLIDPIRYKNYISIYNGEEFSLCE